MMERSLAERWIKVVKPFSMAEIRVKFSESFSKHVGLDDEMKVKLQKVLDNFSEEKAREILLAFAEEHFSDLALKAAVTFFESPSGQKYLEERKTVMAAAMDRMQRYLAQNIMREFGS